MVALDSSDQQNNGEGESAPLLGVEQANEHYFADLKNLTRSNDTPKRKSQYTDTRKVDFFL